MYNENLYAEERKNVDIALAKAFTEGTHSGHGDTGTDCGTKVTAATPCMQGSLQTHENVHAATCQRIKGQLAGQGKSSWTTNYKNSMTIAEYWNDEIAGYQAEIPYINAELEHIRAHGGCLRYECKKGSGVFYDDVVSCMKNCIRKIATLDNWCWEYNPKDNTYTGKKY
jgi:hypothetical protein